MCVNLYIDEEFIDFFLSLSLRLRMLNTLHIMISLTYFFFNIQLLRIYTLQYNMILELRIRNAD